MLIERIAQEGRGWLLGGGGVEPRTRPLLEELPAAECCEDDWWAAAEKASAVAASAAAKLSRVLVLQGNNQGTHWHRTQHLDEAMFVPLSLKDNCCQHDTPECVRPVS